MGSNRYRAEQDEKRRRLRREDKASAQVARRHSGSNSLFKPVPPDLLESKKMTVFWFCFVEKRSLVLSTAPLPLHDARSRIRLTLLLSSAAVESADHWDPIRLSRFSVRAKTIAQRRSRSSLSCDVEDSPVQTTVGVPLLLAMLLDEIECLSEVGNDDDLLIRIDMKLFQHGTERKKLGCRQTSDVSDKSVGHRTRIEGLKTPARKRKVVRRHILREKVCEVRFEDGIIAFLLEVLSHEDSG